MNAIVDALASSPLLLLFAVIGVGSLLGNIRILGFSLGPAGVLFAGILFGSFDGRLRLPDFVYILGLVLFVYTVGLQSGPTFFSSFGRRAFRANVLAFGTIAAAAVIALLGSRLFGLDGASVVGVFCGAMTNTPALAASVEALRQAAGDMADLQTRASAPVVGYSVAYPFGVIGMLLGFHLFRKLRPGGLKKDVSAAEGGSDRPGPITAKTFRVVNPGVVGKSVGSLMKDAPGQGLVFSRMRRGNDSSLVYAETVLDSGDLVVAVGDPSALERAKMLFGEESSEELQTENREFDFRRIEVSDRKVVGKTIAELNLQRLLDATITRIRRGDTDFVPTGSTVLERGDRVRVVTWAGNLDRVAKYLGDSVRFSSEADLFSLSAGMVLGVLLGIAPLPLPGGGTFTLGFAGGPLVAGLVLGRIQHSGPVRWGMPYGVNLTLRQLGIVLFLAGIGTKAGDQFVDTLLHGGASLMAVGAAITVSVAVVGLFASVSFLRLSVPGVLGLVSGIQTQPACLAYANEHAGSDEPNVWYASVYPVSMIAKIILAQLLVAWLV
ncbi:MAG: TrkA C-terminal domain-containing protein [Bacteroidota bacterium]